MSVLYPLTLRRNYTRSRPGKTNSAIKFVLFFLIASISFNGLFAQEVSKEEQARKEAEQTDAKLKANPRLRERLEAIGQLKPLTLAPAPAEQQKIADQQLAEEKARFIAKQAEQDKAGISLPGVEYKVITNGNQVEYIVTNAGNVIFRQQINSSANLYDRQVQAEKEAIYASNSLRRNINYPQDALRAEIKSLINQVSIPVAETRSNNNQRTTADYTFNGGGGTIPATGTSGIASPYPATITVSGVPAGAIVKEVKINGLNHTWSDDVDIVLQSPSGTNVIIMSDAGGAGILTNVNYTFNDGAAVSLADGSGNPSGTYKPTNFDNADNWIAPGPGTAPSAVTLSTFGNGNQNGTWNLFIIDDVGGDSGNWATWSITFTDPPAVCFPINLTGQPANATVCAGTNGSFTVAATPPGVSYNWQVNTGSGFVYLTNGGVYSGVSTATLTITGATLAMNGYQYRVVVTCSQGGLPEISNPATLTVITSPSPPILVATPTSASICPGGNAKLEILSSLSDVTTSSGTISVAIPDNAAGVATNDITVAGFAGTVGAIRVNLNITHTWDGDLRINLRAPNGTILNLVNARGGSGDNFVNTTINSVSGTSLASGTAPFTDVFVADAANAVGIAPFVSNTTLFSNLFSTPNGTWTLAITDHAGGDVGTLTSWSITLVPIGSTPIPATWTPVTGLFNDAGLTSPYLAGNPQAVVYASPAATQTYTATISDGTCSSSASRIVTVNTLPSITVQPGSGNACVGVTKTLSVTAAGTGLTYQWQVDMGAGFVNITTGTPTNPGAFIYTGQTTATLSINSVMATMNGYKYRCVVSGTCPPALNSNEVTLAVNERPAISVVSTSQCSPTTLTASGANTYSWAPSAGLSATTGATVTANPTANTIYTLTGTNTATGCIGTTQVDVKFTPQTPIVAPATPIICAGAVQQLSITSSSSGSTLPNTTSSGAISVAIPDNEFVTGANHALTVSGVTGSIQSISVNFTILHPWDSDLDINLVAPNGNILNLVGARGGSGDNFTNTTISSTSTTSLATGAAPFTGTFAADGNIGWGPSSLASNVSTFASLFSVPNGVWKLAMADFGAGDVGTLTSWSITINYAIPDAGIWTPVTGLFTNAAGTTPYVAGTPAANVYASPAATTTYSVSITNSSTSAKTFSSGGSVTIPGIAPGSTSAGAGAPYPSAIAVSGLPANAMVKSVTVKGVRHSLPDNIDMLLQSPTGVNVVLMSDAGGVTDATGQNYTFDDAAVALMADAALNATGTYKPTNYGASDTYPAPIGAISQATPTLASFTGDPNGTWNLYISDEFAVDVGLISAWEITFTIPDPTNCTSTPRTVTVTVQAAIVYTTQPANRTACQNGSVTFTAAATGTITTTQWQVSTNGGTTWTDIPGATTTTLTLTNVQPSQNGYRYRLALSNAGCGAVNSNAAILTVNPLPTVSLNLSPAGQTQLSPGKQTIVTVSSSPAGASYQWFINGVAEPSITGSSYAVDAHHLGTYTVRVTDVNGCVSTTSGVTFTALPTFQLFIYPNPTSGAFYVTYFMPQVNTGVTLVVIDMMGRRLIERHEVTTGPYTRFDFSDSKLAAGVYIIEFRNSGGQRLAAGQLVVVRD
jgi:subtilisin-like proprotein convertase family protein